LVDLVNGDPAFIQIVTDLRGQADLILNWHLQVITARDRSFSRATDVFDTDQGKQIMDGIRGKMDQIDNLRSEKLKAIREQLNRRVSRAGLTSLGAEALAVGIGIISIVNVKRSDWNNEAQIRRHYIGDITCPSFWR
jgi:CHASE3 domain sensor protein